MTDIRGEICKIISAMLDNPDEYGIYPTTKCYDEFEALFSLALLQERERCAELTDTQYEKQVPLMEAGNQSDDYKCGYDDACGDLGHAIRALLDPCGFTREIVRDVEIGRITMRFVDRMNDPTDGDPLEKSVGEFIAAIHVRITALQGEEHTR